MELGLGFWAGLQSEGYSVIGVPLEYFVVLAGVVIALLIVAIIAKKKVKHFLSVHMC